MPDIKSMSLPEAQEYKQSLKDQGYTLSTSKEMGKVEDYIKTLSPEKYGEETVTSAYKKLSSGVTEYGGWTEANLSELNARGIPNMLGQGSAGAGGDLNTYLDSYQNSVYGASNNVELRDSITNQIEPEGGVPDTIDWSDMRGDLNEEYGVIELETFLNNLTTQLEEEYAITRARTQDVEGKPFGNMGVISGRIGEIERQQTDRIDAIGRQINVITRQLNTAYNAISVYMQDERMEYDDAVNKYKMEFERNLQIYNLIDDEMDEITAAARANLTLYSNAIMSGNMSYDSMSGSEKAMIAGLEAQSGLPIGFISSLGMSFKDRLMGTSADGTQAWVIGEDGNMTVINTGLTAKKTGTGSGGAFSTSVMNQATAKLEELDVAHDSGVDEYDQPTKTVGDKQFSPKEWEAAKNAMRAYTDTEEEAQNLFNRAMAAYGGEQYTGWVNE